MIPERDFLHRVFQGDDLDYQAEKVLRIVNPYKEEKARRQVQDYDNKEKEGEGDEVTEDDLPV